jgi:ribosomal protein L32
MFWELCSLMRCPACGYYDFDGHQCWACGYRPCGNSYPY